MSARVLVVDDDPWILRMVSSTLQKRSFVVDTAKEGTQALERARAAKPDLIISDVMMPGMDGWTFVQQVRSTPGLAGVPIILLTALGKDEARLRSLGLDSEDFLSKPFRFSDLEKRVNAALSKGSTPPTPPRPEPSRVGPLPGRPEASHVGPLPGPPGRESYVGPLPGPPPQGRQTYESTMQPLPRPPEGYPPGYPAYPPGYPYGTPYGQGYPAGYPYPGYPPGYHPAGMPHAHPGYPPYPAAVPPEGAAPPPPTPATPEAKPPEPSAARDDAGGASSFGGRRTTALHGRIEQLQLSSLLVMMEMERKDGILTLKDAKTEAVGRIFLRGGQVICARVDEQDDLDGRESVYAMLCWKTGNFSFSAMEVDMEDTVQSSTTHLLMEGARLMDESNR